MKRFSKLIITFCFLLAFLICIPSVLQVQADPGDGDPGNPCGDPGSPNPDCPIDGGLTALLAIGVGYGIKKVREARKS